MATSVMSKPLSEKEQHLRELSDDLHFFNGGGPGGKAPKTQRSHDQIEEEEIEEMLAEADGDGAASASPAEAKVLPPSQQPSAAAQAQARIARKLNKRALRAHSISEDGRFGGASGMPPNSERAMLKNSRKSRSALGRGLPKKGEGGKREKDGKNL